MDESNSKAKRTGKVIRNFTVEIMNLTEGTENQSNPYAEMSDEERLSDLIEIFGALWAETCRNRKMV